MCHPLNSFNLSLLYVTPTPGYALDCLSNNFQLFKHTKPKATHIIETALSPKLIAREYEWFNCAPSV